MNNEPSLFKSDTMYKKYKKDIQKRSYTMLLFMCLGLSFLGLLLTLINVITNVFHAQMTYVSLSWVVTSGVTLFIFQLSKRWVLRHSVGMLYLYTTLIMCSMIICGTFLYTEAPSSIVIGCIACLPIILFDRVFRFCLFDISICTVFIVSSIFTKDISIAIVDAVNALVFCIVSCLIGIYTISLKFKDVRTKYSAIEKLDTDPLTGLTSRNTAIQRIESYYQNPNCKPSALFLIDIDYFKEINDTYGHIVGDTVLREFADIMRDSFHSSDCIARLGGDEFLVFIGNVKAPAQIKHTATQLRANLRHGTDELNARGITVNVSIGISLTQGQSSFKDAYEHADKMLYEVKRSGRSGYKIEVA